MPASNVVPPGSERPIRRPGRRRVASALAAVAFLLLAAAGGGLVSASAAGPVCDDSWTNPAGGAWSTPGNWSGGVPGATQSVCVTIPVSAPVTGGGLTLAGLTVGGSTGTSVSTELDLNGTNTINGDVTVTDTGKLAVQGTFVQTSGTFTIDGAFATSANLMLKGSGNVIVAPDGFFDVPTGQLQLLGPGTFTNEGELAVSTTMYADPSPGTMTFDNAGGILADAGGDIQMQAGATFVEGAGQVTGTLGNAGAAVKISGGTLDLTGSGASTFVLAGGTLEGTIASTQTVQLSGTNTTAGSVRNDGDLVALSGGTLTVASGTTLSNDGTFALRTGSMNLYGTVDNGSDGTLALNSQLVLQPPYDVTNDGTISISPAGGVIGEHDTGMTATFDNDGGTIANGSAGTGGFVVTTGATFVEGAGSTTGNPVNVQGALDLTGSGAANLQVTSGTIEGDVAAGQIVAIRGTDQAAASFENNGTMTLSASTLNLPSGGTLTNDGQLGVFSGTANLNGNLTNEPDGILDVASQLADSDAGATIDNQGELYMLNQQSIFLAPGVGFTSTGDVMFGIVGGSWGGFGNHGDFESNGTPPQTVELGGSFEPVFPEQTPGNTTLPPQWVSPEPGSISYGVAYAPGTSTTTTEDVITCDASTPTGVSLGCTTQGGLQAIEMFLTPAIVPTNVSIASSAPLSSACGVSCPTSSYGQSVTLIATVAPEYGTASPTGNVTFFDGPLVIGSGTVATSAGVTTATLTTTSLAPGTHEFSALYTGDGGNLAGNSNQLEESVGLQSTTTAVAPVPSSSALGQPVTLTATVTPSGSAPESPTGEVVFLAGSNVLGAAAVSTSGGAGTASFTTTALPVGASDQITAQYEGDANYASSTSASAPAAVGAPAAPTTVNVSGPSSADPGTTYSATASANGGIPTLFALAAAPAPNGGLSIDPASGAIAYAVPSSGVTSFSYTVVALDAAGRAESTVVTVSVPTPQTIAFTAPSGGVVNGSDSLSPTATSGLAVALSVDAATSPAGACTLSPPSGGSYTVDYVHAGSCVLDANQAGGSGYLPAPRVQQTIAIARAGQTVGFTSTSPGTVAYGGTPYDVSASSSADLPVTIALDVSSHGCTLTDAVVTFTGTGTCVIDATQAGTSDYLPAAATPQSISVTPATQTITFTAPAAGAVKGSSTLAPSASSTLPVTLAVNGSKTTNGACSLAGNVVSYLHTGSCVIDATQSGNAEYQSAATVERTIAVGPATQTVSFTTTAPSSATAGGPTYQPAAQATSALPVTIALDPASTGCTLGGGVVSFTAAGTCVIDASQAGNADYQAAATVKQTIPVAAGGPAVTPASLRTLTLTDVQGSTQYKALGPLQKAIVTATVTALTNVLTPVGPHLSPAANAVLIELYDTQVVTLLRSGGWLTPAQAATLIADAGTL